MAYPASFDTLAVDLRNDTDSKTGVEDGSDVAVGYHPQLHIDERTAIMAIEAELGTDPSEEFSTVKERLQARDLKQSARAATAAALPAYTASGGGTVLTANANGVLAAQDGVTLVVGDRLFVKDESVAPANNGIYAVTSLGAVGAPWVLTRSTDADTAVKISDSQVITVEQGPLAGDTGWELNSDNPITVGTTALYFTRIWPDYASIGPRNPWNQGIVGGNFNRDRWSGNIALPTAATWVFMGGGVLQAGRPVSNVNIYITTAGSGWTIRHFSLVRASDRTVLQRTANAGTTPAATTMLVTPLQATYTPSVDVPFYLVLGLAATGAPSMAMTQSAASAALVGAIGSALPMAYTTTTGAPTTTPPAVGAVIGAASGTNLANVPCYFLS